MTRRLPTSDDYWRHVEELCRAFSVRLLVRPSMPPHAAHAGRCRRTGRPCIVIAPVTDDTTYAVALHELGHMLHPAGTFWLEVSAVKRRTGAYATLRDVRLTLEAERNAWAWARRMALDWTPAMAGVRRMCLGAYRQQARRFTGRA